MESAITVTKLGKRFRRRHADAPTTLKGALFNGLRGTRPDVFWGLHDVSFSIKPGRTVGIIGRNGAGKSTLLRLVGGVGRPDAGRIQAHGRIGALLDLGAGQHPELTGRECIFISGVISGMTRAEVARRYDDIVAFAELEAFIDNPLRTYSTGMQMRLAFAVAVHIDPQILLIDEVLAVGDLSFQSKCLERIAQFKQQGCTILLVSHDPGQIRSLSDEVIWLQGGEVVMHGPTEPVLEQYVRSMEHNARSADADLAAVSLANGNQLKLDVNRFGSQELQITAVRLLSEAGEPVTSLPNGAGLQVELVYNAPKPIEAPQASVSINQQDGTTCLDISTDADGFCLPTLEGSGIIRLKIDRLDLAGGDYFVNVGLYEQHWDYTYDYHWEAYPLRIVDAKNGKGLLQPPTSWQISAKTDPAKRLLESALVGVE